MIEDLYERREQTRVKHYILQRYLERFAHIVGSHWESITYVDGFAGPWNVRSPELKDSSFYIALEELRKARATHALKRKNLDLRCFFLEEGREAFRQLEEFSESVKDAEVKAENGSFEQSVGLIQKFVYASRLKTFPFIFIDPTGWTGFSLKLISPLLKLDPGEVLVNFMTSHIRRFTTQEQVRQSLVDLFGSDRFIEKVAGLFGQELEDALVTEYMECVKREGNFKYVLSAIVLHPEIDRTHFHLIYCTRHPRGVEVFKNTEKSAMQQMERLRAGAQKRKQQERAPGQGFLFEQTEEIQESKFYGQLRERYLRKAKAAVTDHLQRYGRVLYSDVWSVALQSPLVWESDLKDWLKEWQSSHKLQIEGLKGKERVPSRDDKSHVLAWQGKRN